MSAGSANLLIEKGADFSKTFTIKDKTTKTPINISGCTFDFDIAAKQGGDIVFTIPMTIVDGPTGIVKAELSKTNIETIILKQGWFVINITWSNGFTERLVEGLINISKGVKV